MDFGLHKERMVGSGYGRCILLLVVCHCGVRHTGDIGSCLQVIGNFDYILRIVLQSVLAAHMSTDIRSLLIQCLQFTWRSQIFPSVEFVSDAKSDLLRNVSWNR